jgi:carbon monoxide dehydrogenase subunit G
MKKFAILALATLLSFATGAYAHGPVRGKLTATISIDAPAAKVWNIIKDFHDMSWLPEVKSLSFTGSNANNPGTIRTLTLVDGNTIIEELKAYDESKMTYKYKITGMSAKGKIKHAGQDEEIPALPVGNYAAEISVKDKGGKAEVEWVATYYRAYVNNNPPAELNEEAADKAVSEVFTQGLQSLSDKVTGRAGKVEIEVKR